MRTLLLLALASPALTQNTTPCLGCGPVTHDQNSGEACRGITAGAYSPPGCTGDAVTLTYCLKATGGPDTFCALNYQTNECEGTTCSGTATVSITFRDDDPAGSCVLESGYPVYARIRVFENGQEVCNELEGYTPGTEGQPIDICPLPFMAVCGDTARTFTVVAELTVFSQQLTPFSLASSASLSAGCSDCYPNVPEVSWAAPLMLG